MKDLLKAGVCGLAIAIAVGVAAEPVKARAQESSQPTRKPKTLFDDPVTLEHPYSYTRYYEWRPDVRPAEYICEENNRNAPVNGVTVAR